MKRVVFFVLLLVSSTSVFAQVDAKKNEIGLTLGAEILPQQTTSAGATLDFSKGIAFGANYARHLGGENVAAYLEFPFVAVPNHDVRTTQANVLRNLATLYITPSLRVQFAKNSVLSPWISGGFGYGLLESSAEFPDGTPNPDKFVHSGTVQFGGGVDIRTPVKILFPLSLRGEVRDFYTLDAANYGTPLRNDGQHNVVVAGGFVVHF